MLVWKELKALSCQAGAEFETQETASQLGAEELRTDRERERENNMLPCTQD